MSDDINKPWLKETWKEIKSIINNQNFIVEDPNKGEPEAKIQSDGSIEKLKIRIVVGGYLQNKELFGDNWSSLASMRNLKYFLAYAAKHKTRVHQLGYYGK